MFKSLWNKKPQGDNNLWIPSNYDTSHQYYLSFDKSDDGVKCNSVNGNSVYDSATPNAPFTANVWVYAKSNGEATLGTIVHKGHNNPTGINVGYQMHVFVGNATRTKLGFNIRHGDGSDAQQATMADNANSGTGSLLLNQWQMVTMVYNGDGDKKIRGYVNGTEIATYSLRQAGTGNVRDDSTEPLIIGNKNSGQVTWDGYIRDLKIFKGIALTPTQISNLFTGTVPSGLTSYYDFHEGRGYALHDIRGGGHGILGRCTGSGASPVFSPSGATAIWGIYS